MAAFRHAGLRALDRSQPAAGFTASAAATDAWASKPGAAWPCSTLAGHRLRVELDPRNGDLVGLTVDSQDDTDGLDGHELRAFQDDATAGFLGA
jgi:hypothetical protein